MPKKISEDQFSFISQHELDRFLAFKKTADEHAKRLKDWKKELMERVDDGAIVEDGTRRIQVIEKTSIPYKKGFDRAVEVLIEAGLNAKAHGVNRFLGNRATVSRFVNVK